MGGLDRDDVRLALVNLDDDSILDPKRKHHDAVILDTLHTVGVSCVLCSL